MPERENSEPILEPFQGTAPSPTLPDKEDLIGPRIAAALIDVGLLVGLGVILGLTVGESGPGKGVSPFLYPLPGCGCSCTVR
jgi:hypothetical protein